MLPMLMTRKNKKQHQQYKIDWLHEIKEATHVQHGQ